jgi:peptide/nickel transport system substrate-binding protein
MDLGQIVILGMVLPNQLRVVLAASLATALPAVAQRPADHGAAVIVLGQEPASPVPTLIAGSSANASVADLLFLRLARPGRTLVTTDERSFEPELARSWSRRDSLTLVFELDPRARWHDGVPVTSRDAVFSYARMRDSTVDPQKALVLRPIASVTAQGEHRVIIRFRESYPEQLYDATFHVQLLPAHLVDSIPPQRFAESGFARAPVGSGPYRWVRRVPGQRLELAGNPEFFLGAPKIDRLVFLVVRDVEAALNLMLDGTADIYEAVPPVTGPPRLAANSALKLAAAPSFNVLYLLFNQKAYGDRNQPHPVLADAEVRRALVMAIDRARLVQSTYAGFGAIAGAPAAQGHWTFRLVPGQRYDPAAAGKLLEARGYRRGPDGMLEKEGTPLVLRLNVPSTSAPRMTMATQIQEQLRRIGVKIELAPLDGPVWQQRRQRGEFDIDFSAAVLDPSPRGIVQSWTCAGQTGSNMARFCDPEFDRLLERAMGARNAGESEWRQAYQRLQADAPAAFLVSPSLVFAVHRRYRNVTLRPESLYGDLWRWSVDPARRIARDR